MKIPTFQHLSADTVQEIELGGQLVQLRIIYNIRAGYFFLTFMDQSGNTLYGIKIVPDWPLLEYHKGFTDFTGDLIVQKTDQDASNNITYDNFGNGWDLFYLSQNEITAWKEENGF